jgi:hypothetical protein
VRYLAPLAYAPVYYGEQVMESVFLFAVVFELLRFAFWPLDLLPFAQRRVFLIGIAALVALSIAVSALWPYVNNSRPISAVQTFDRASMGIACGVLFLLTCISKRLEIPWRRRAHGVVAGFILYLPVRVAVTASLSNCSQDAILFLSLVQMTAFLISVTTWIVIFIRPDTQSFPITATQLQPIIKLLDQLKLDYQILEQSSQPAPQRI